MSVSKALFNTAVAVSLSSIGRGLYNDHTDKGEQLNLLAASVHILTVSIFCEAMWHQFSKKEKSEKYKFVKEDILETVMNVMDAVEAVEDAYAERSFMPIGMLALDALLENGNPLKLVPLAVEAYDVCKNLNSEDGPKPLMTLVREFFASQLEAGSNLKFESKVLKLIERRLN